MDRTTLLMIRMAAQGFFVLVLMTMLLLPRIAHLAVTL